MKAITNTIANNKEIIAISLVILGFIGLIVYNILTHGIHSV
jgi:preprotein translocase subunit Sss1